MTASRAAGHSLMPISAAATRRAMPAPPPCCRRSSAGSWRRAAWSPPTRSCTCRRPIRCRCRRTSRRGATFSIAGGAPPAEADEDLPPRLSFQFQNDRHVIGRLLPGAGLPHDLQGLQSRAQRRRRQDVIQPPAVVLGVGLREAVRSEEHTSELQSLMRISYAVFCWKKKNNYIHIYLGLLNSVNVYL